MIHLSLKKSLLLLENRSSFRIISVIIESGSNKYDIIFVVVEKENLYCLSDLLPLIEMELLCYILIQFLKSLIYVTAVGKKVY